MFPGMWSQPPCRGKVSSRVDVRDPNWSTAAPVRCHCGSLGGGVWVLRLPGVRLAFHQTSWTRVADLIRRRHGAVEALRDVLRRVESAGPS